MKSVTMLKDDGAVGVQVNDVQRKLFSVTDRWLVCDHKLLSMS
jgi:hypothetical protein